MKVYLIPGLGYDHRIFSNLDLKGLSHQFINWIEPVKDESMHEYATRLFRDIPTNDEEVVLIGHSLGGIVAQEIASEMNIKQIILLSSIKSRKELPLFFKILKPLKLYKLFRKEMVIKTIKYWGTKHGFISSSEKDLFRSMVGSQTNNYLQWALKVLSGWRPGSTPLQTKIIQIHGNKDLTFPIKLIKSPNEVIENGSHVMVYTQPTMISELILKYINPLH
jgi:pimeloyl-ACP methyl ester carboxylesterase